jgi:hypothetical protein
MGLSDLISAVNQGTALALARRGFLEIDLRAFLSCIAGSIPMGVIVFFALSIPQTFAIKVALLPVVCVVGGLVYIVSLRALRLLTVEDIDFIRELTPRKLQWFLPRIASLAGIGWKTE